MNIDKKFLSKNDKLSIEKNLSVVIKSDYGPPKKYKIYKNNDEYSVPLSWGMKNLPHVPTPSYQPFLINIKTPSIKLRPLQEKCITECEKELSKDIGGGIINLKTGGGKTVCSLYLIGKYKLKTLIIVNTVELMRQWESSIRKFIPDVKIGKIQGDLFQTDCDITIGMVQTISMRKEYTPDRFSTFSMVIIDEVHHMSSQVFSEALFKTRVKYVFGLSATIERKDGLECVFKWHIGDILFSDSNLSKKQKTKFLKIDYTGPSSKEIFTYDGKPKISTMITNIAEDLQRTKTICNFLKNLDDNRKVLVLSDRISQLKMINKILGNKTSGLFIGKTPKEEKESTRGKMVMLATYQIASEGFDHPELNTLVFATPRSSVTQAVGRIYRKIHEDKPMIIDVVDWFSVFPYQYKKRKIIYSKEIDCKKEEPECLFE